MVQSNGFQVLTVDAPRASAVSRPWSGVAALLVVCAVLAACSLTQSQSFWATDRIAELDRALTKNDFDLADRLIERYDGVLSPGKALDLGIRRGSLEVVGHYLLVSGINKALDDDGVTALIRAVQSAPERKREAIVRRLLAAGADPMATDRFGRSAIDYANFSGNPALALFLESGGSAYYRSGPARHVAWLPELTWQAQRTVRNRATGIPGSAGSPSGKAAASPGAAVLRRSPLDASRGGIPDPLFASTWVPDLAANGPDGSATARPLAALRFHADGTGELMRYFPEARRTEPDTPAHLAWTMPRGEALRFVVLTAGFASYCKSMAGAAGRFGINCIDYAAAEGNLAAVLADGLSDASARQLLANGSQRSRLQVVGETNSVLRTAAAQLCKPVRADASLREGLPARAADARRPGNWIVFDAARFAAWPSAGPACTQREARIDALNACRRSGGTCRSIGGCAQGEAAAVASVAGYDWAALSCNADAARAKQEALDKCRKLAGCDCQIIHLSVKPAIRSSNACP